MNVVSARGTNKVAVGPGVSFRGWRRHRLLLPSSLVLLLLAVLFAGRSPAGLMVVALLVLGLTLVVFAHRRLQRGGYREAGERSLLRTPGQVALAVLVAVVFGGVIAVLASIVLAAIASRLAGDGSLLVRLCMGVFVLAPCMAVGSRCGRWWAFLGAAGLIPILALSVLLSGGRAESGLGLAVVGVVSVALAVATGSLNQQLARARVGATTRTASTARSAEGESLTGRAAVSAGG